MLNEPYAAISFQQGAKLLREKFTEEPIQISGDDYVEKKLEDGNSDESHEMATNCLNKMATKCDNEMATWTNWWNWEESEATSHEHPVEPLEESDKVQPVLSSSNDFATADQPIDSQVFWQAKGLEHAF